MLLLAHSGHMHSDSGAAGVRLLEQLWLLTGESAPWLVIGLFVAGLMRALVPSERLGSWLGGTSIWGPIRAAVIGTPLPLCSCSVMPVAAGLRRSGASRGSTTSFLIATPVNGADSVAVSYALLGPFLTIARLVAALCCAVVAGVLGAVFGAERESVPQSESASGCGCCCKHTPEPEQNGDGTSCCHDEEARPSVASGIRYAFTDLYDDLVPWLVIGLGVGAAFGAFVPVEFVESWGRGPLAMFVMVLIGLPMYVCATASVPLAGAMLASGVSPGAVLVFLIAGPATNVGLLGFIKRELGGKTLAAYLISVTAVPIALGVATNEIARAVSIDFATEIDATHAITPGWLQIVCVAVLVVLAIRPVRRLFIGPAAGHSH